MSTSCSCLVKKRALLQHFPISLLHKVSNNTHIQHKNKLHKKWQYTCVNENHEIVKKLQQHAHAHTCTYTHLLKSFSVVKFLVDAKEINVTHISTCLCCQWKWWD